MICMYCLNYVNGICSIGYDPEEAISDCEDVGISKVRLNLFFNLIF